MQQRTSILLAGVAVLAIGAAWQFGIRATPSSQVEAVAGTLVFPGLAARLGQVARIDIQGKGAVLGIIQANGKWGLADRAGFPVQQDKLRELLTGLTELRLTEARTSDPTQYSRLGVEDPTPTGTSNLLRLLDAAGKPIAELIVGHRRVRTQGNVPETIFVRRPGEAQSWMAEGRLPVDSDPQLWFERDIANIAGPKVIKATVTRGDATLEFARSGDKFVLTAPVDHPKTDDYRIEEVSRAFETLTLTDVRPATSPQGEKIGTAVHTLADGTGITTTVFRADKDIWITLSASGETEAARELNARTKGWTYQVGAWKEKSFTPTLDDLKASEPEKPEAEPSTE
jgi:hypothetical protein